MFCLFVFHGRSLHLFVSIREKQTLELDSIVPIQFDEATLPAHGFSVNGIEYFSKIIKS